MSEELLQKDLINNPPKIGKWDFYNIGATTVEGLKKHGIIRSIDYGEVANKKVDGIITTSRKLSGNKDVIAVLEYKAPKEFNTPNKQAKAIAQARLVAQKLGAKLVIATDTQQTIWVNTQTNERILDEDGFEITTVFNDKDEKTATLIAQIHTSINKHNNQIKPRKLVNPTDLAKQIWQDALVGKWRYARKLLVYFCRIICF